MQAGCPGARARCGCTLASLSESATAPAGVEGLPACTETGGVTSGTSAVWLHTCEPKRECSHTSWCRRWVRLAEPAQQLWAVRNHGTQQPVAIREPAACLADRASCGLPYCTHLSELSRVPGLKWSGGKFGGGDGFCVQVKLWHWPLRYEADSASVETSAVPVSADPRRHWLFAPPPMPVNASDLVVL